MKKAERLNLMLKFINQKKRFTLSDLMAEFHISKRTALRDIASLEEMGAPIYVEYGRNGGYYLLDQMKLPPISFNSQEVYALYLSLQVLEGFTDLPFKVTYESIHRKFHDALSDQQKEKIARIKNRVVFYQTKQVTKCPCLEMMMTAIIEHNVLKIRYRDAERLIQPLVIYALKGHWYCQSFDMEKREYRVFRCDRILHAELTETEPLNELEHVTMLNSHSLWKPSEKAISFKCLLDDGGIAIFQTEHYPSMRLVHEENHTYLIGTFEPNEWNFIVRYLSRYGKSLKIIEPEELKIHMKEYYMDFIRQL
ncbi:helix-turn-helix transcriptional regulator [Anoxybacteroides rupiense]|uniref:YafY family protein n=1 Tax=Anoxybacteroides rupiense TaxID=311460 RepID=A0ABD5IYA7_9BACL|nr:YafY family protein [Anoxybacillus rupiensis]MBB3908835.1 putative DNA-binding transcriptional regulator YafY [Anoxybacillus rupiensis]MED5052779.1 YafY family protein [Anoxybacillus rupiensis]